MDGAGRRPWQALLNAPHTRSMEKGVTDRCPLGSSARAPAARPWRTCPARRRDRVNRLPCGHVPHTERAVLRRRGHARLQGVQRQVIDRAAPWQALRMVHRRPSARRPEHPAQGSGGGGRRGRRGSAVEAAQAGGSAAHPRVRGAAPKGREGGPDACICAFDARRVRPRRFSHCLGCPAPEHDGAVGAAADEALAARREAHARHRGGVVVEGLSEAVV
jgi:hypothetical protein